MIRNLTKRFDDLDGALRLLIRAGNRALNRNFTFLGKVLVGETLGIPRYLGFGIGTVRVNRRDRSGQLGQSISRLGIALDLNLVNGIKVHDMRRHLDLSLNGHAVVR